MDIYQFGSAIKFWESVQEECIKVYKEWSSKNSFIQFLNYISKGYFFRRFLKKTHLRLYVLLSEKNLDDYSMVGGVNVNSKIIDDLSSNLDSFERDLRKQHQLMREEELSKNMELN